MENFDCLNLTKAKKKKVLSYLPTLLFFTYVTINTFSLFFFIFFFSLFGLTIISIIKAAKARDSTFSFSLVLNSLINLDDVLPNNVTGQLHLRFPSCASYPANKKIKS